MINPLARDRMFPLISSLFLVSVSPVWSRVLVADNGDKQSTSPQGMTAATLPLPDKNATGQRGAAVPFVTSEAEAATNHFKGTKVMMSGLPSREASTPEMEASGRGYVQLTQTGDFVEFPIAQTANALVVRHCIPDAPAGGGISAPLNLYVNGKLRQTLTLSSKHNWLYGEAGENGQSNDPTKGQAHVFWDESRFLLSKPIRKGDTLRLQKDATNTADFYRIDLVDTENAPPALVPPPKGTFLSVADFGAKGNDQIDDTQAITNCIAAAKATNKTVWIPAGTYYQSARFTLDGVKLRGDGMWRTELISTVEGDNWFGNIGFQLNGENPQVSDLYMDSDAHTSRSTGGKAFTGGANNWRIQNVWMTHTLCGLWFEGKNGIMSGCRIRSTYADAINLNNGASNNLIENNHVRGSGDDGIAILSETELKKPPSFHNTVRFNTVSAVWWGHNGDLAGGSGHVIEDNIFVDNAKMGVFTINLPGSFPMNPLSNSIVCRNSFVRGGGNYAWQKRGAVWIYAGSTTITNVFFQDNLILNPIFRGIQLTGGESQNITFERNIIDAPGENAIQIESDATGSASFESNTVRNLPKDLGTLVNNSKDKFVLNQSKNSWQ
ncbi:hypothetical protein IAD21_03369 [Abditibacteriota bacterium]|nr:hypothetical protein IAD21_03369 [Abditibacteriota bacterium]